MTTMNPTKIALLDLAQQILQTQSFANVSFQTLAKGVGIKKGSVYYHFESKEELGEAIIERVTAQLRQGLIDIQDVPITKQLHVYTNWFRDHIGAADKLCPGASLASSWGAVSASTQQKVQKLYDVHKKGLASIISRGRESGEFTDSGKSADELAIAVFALLQGGLLAARVAENKQAFEVCKATALQLVKHG